ncbi:P-loop containing nucleoside triphosphate hydrolase protein [Russula aff. rugulosa BPL654]|nr:P-loop containing nucleoside triphosphate hydrolase protein [Russula aff. rugulosa BPL654]
MPQSRSQELINVKLLLIGNSSIGKSSLLLRFSDKQSLLEDEASSTIGVDFRVHRMEAQGRKVMMSIWDTAGQELPSRRITAERRTSYSVRVFTALRFSLRGSHRGSLTSLVAHALPHVCYGDMHLVYDVSNRESFEAVPRWLEELESYVPPEVVKIVVENKLDKEYSRRVLTSEGAAFASRRGCLFVDSLWDADSRSSIFKTSGSVVTTSSRIAAASARALQARAAHLSGWTHRLRPRRSAVPLHPATSLSTPRL